jgi:hypothetical protein
MLGTLTTLAALSASGCCALLGGHTRAAWTETWVVAAPRGRLEGAGERLDRETCRAVCGGTPDSCTRTNEPITKEPNDATISCESPEHRTHRTHVPFREAKLYLPEDRMVGANACAAWCGSASSAWVCRIESHDPIDSDAPRIACQLEHDSCCELFQPPS